MLPYFAKNLKVLDLSNNQVRYFQCFSDDFGPFSIDFGIRIPIFCTLFATLEDKKWSAQSPTDFISRSIPSRSSRSSRVSISPHSFSRTTQSARSTRKPRTTSGYPLTTRFLVIYWFLLNLIVLLLAPIDRSSGCTMSDSVTFASSIDSRIAANWV